MIPFDKLSREPLPDPCRCPVCDGSCARQVRRKWFQCRPCTKGYHIAPCEVFIESEFPKFEAECVECGWLEAEH